MRSKGPNPNLTSREKEILSSLAAGKFYKEIAGEFHICIDTVKKHCKNIYRKLHVKNRKEAAVLSAENLGTTQFVIL
jgi:DNA-binding NarL/FixJ family response regulator